MGVGAPDVPQPSTSSSSSSSTSTTFQVGMLSNFLINGEALHPTGLCLIWFWATIFSLNLILPCSVTSSTLMLRQLQLIILLFRRNLMSFLLREQKNPPQVVLVSILACLSYLSILGAFVPYSISSILIIICTFLLLRCQLLKPYGSLSSMVILLFPLIYKMLIYIFPLLSIIVISYILFGIMCLISGRFYPLGLPQPLGFLLPSQNLFCSFAIARACVLLFTLDDILVLLCSKWAHLFLCSLLVRLGLHINFSKLDLHLSQSFTFLGLCWDTVCMSVSLPPGKLADIQQLALSLLHTPHVTVCKVMSFLGKANFCTTGHSQLWHLCSVIQSDMLSVYHSPTQLFSHVHFSLSSLRQLEWLSTLQQSPVPLHFPLSDVVIATDAIPTQWAFYFQGSGLPLQELQAVAIMLCRMAFCLSGKVVDLHFG